MRFHTICEYLGMDSNKLKGFGIIDEPARWAATGAGRTFALGLTLYGGYQLASVANEAFSNLAQLLGSRFIPQSLEGWAGRNIRPLGNMAVNTFNAFRPTTNVTRLPNPLQPVSRRLAIVVEAVVILSAGKLLVNLMHNKVRTQPQVVKDLIEWLTPFKSQHKEVYKAELLAGKK